MTECLDSIKSQTYKNFVAILVDDCSVDNSATIAQKYVKNDTRFILLQKPKNEGLGMARNTGLDYIYSTLKPQNSDYIGFVDSDDVVAMDYYANLIYCLESHAKRGIMVAKSYNYYRFRHESYNKDIFAYRARKQKGRVTNKCKKIIQWAFLYRVPFLEHLRFPNVRLAEDVSFGNLVNALADKIAYTRAARYFYRQRAGSLMSNWNYSYDESFANFAFMLESFAKFDLLKSHKIDISLVENMPCGVENKCFEELQKFVLKFNFGDEILRVNPQLKAIVDSKDYVEFHAKITKLKPLKERVKHYFCIDIRPSRIYLKFFGCVLINKRFR